MTNGWDRSADAWIKDMGNSGDKGRQFILDPALDKLIAGRGFKRALDVGCGEGRMCRYMQSKNIKTIGIDPTKKLLQRARELDKEGEYIEAFAEELPLNDNEFDLVLSCMTLIDIPDFRSAIREMVRVLQPNGTLLIANCTAMNTAGSGLGWQKDVFGNFTHYAIDNYREERQEIESWRGISIVNHHRPLSAYMQCFLENGLTLRHYDEPAPIGGAPDWVIRLNRIPWFVIMEWQKPSNNFSQ